MEEVKKCTDEFNESKVLYIFCDGIHSWSKSGTKRIIKNNGDYFDYIYITWSIIMDIYNIWIL